MLKIEGKKEKLRLLILKREHYINKYILPIEASIEKIEDEIKKLSK